LATVPAGAAFAEACGDVDIVLMFEVAAGSSFAVPSRREAAPRVDRCLSIIAALRVLMAAPPDDNQG
jgi:hypothetical protein